MITPPAPCTGSPMNAATFSGRVRLHDVLDARDRQTTLCMHELHSTETCASHRRAVISIPAADENPAARLPGHFPIVPREAKCSVVGFGPGIAEKEMRELAARELRQARSQQHSGHRRRSEERVVVRQLQHLLVRSARQLFSAIAYVYAPQAGHAVEQGASLGIVNATALGTRDDPASAQLLHEPVVLLRRKVMGKV